MSESSDISNVAHPPKAGFGFVTLVLFLLVLFWLAGRWLMESQPSVGDEETVRSIERIQIIEGIREEDAEKLNTYGWIDREEGIVRIPIERAMALELAALRDQGEPQPAYPVDQPLAPPEEETDEEAPAAPEMTEEATVETEEAEAVADLEAAEVEVEEREEAEPVEQEQEAY